MVFHHMVTIWTVTVCEQVNHLGIYPVTDTNVNSAIHPYEVGKSSTSLRASFWILTGRSS